jgi:hypothetical protein
MPIIDWKYKLTITGTIRLDVHDKDPRTLDEAIDYLCDWDYDQLWEKHDRALGSRNVETVGASLVDEG